MIDQIARLRISIEEKRKELLHLAKQKPLADPDVVKISQELDGIINEYQMLRQNYIFMLKNREV